MLCECGILVLVDERKLDGLAGWLADWLAC